MNGKSLIEDFGAFVKALPDEMSGRMAVTRVDGVMYNVEILRGVSEDVAPVEGDVVPDAEGVEE